VHQQEETSDLNKSVKELGSFLTICHLINHEGLSFVNNTFFVKLSHLLVYVFMGFVLNLFSQVAFKILQVELVHLLLMLESIMDSQVVVICPVH